ncbi:MAG: hypothetical protein K0S53_1400 [Bacteroidetes bacterium]|jgi:hypothetical protein|nr:hypothetical protein [Bacteroidota bacterium]MDF2452606.1 hypothetical protein [Bacteroidota bacterium]
MRSALLFCFLIILFSQGKIQAFNFPPHFSKTEIAKLKQGDSLTYYQCHVDSAFTEMTLSNGQKVKTKKKRITLTEKYVINLKDSIYTVKYYIAGFNSYPNKKFPYLTLTETDTWYFDLKKTTTLSIQEVLLFAALETKTHSIVHFELNINKTCPNEVIIKGKNVNEQFIVEGNYLLSRSLGF